jgi:hypothetical protein
MLVVVLVLVDAPASTVRYHLQVAVRADLGLREEHQASLVTSAKRPPKPGLRNLADVLIFHRAGGRQPVAQGESPRERALGVWLHRRRQESSTGALSPTYQDALAVIPGWDRPSRRREEARWQRRLEEVQQCGTPAATGQGTRRPKTSRNDPWECGFTANESTTGQASWTGQSGRLKDLLPGCGKAEATGADVDAEHQ